MIKVALLKVDDPELTIVEMPNSLILKAMQDLVGGHVQMIYITPDIQLYLNEEGKIEGLESNFYLLNKGAIVDEIVGNCFFATIENDDIASLTDKQLEEIKKRFINREIFNIGR